MRGNLQSIKDTIEMGKRFKTLLVLDQIVRKTALDMKKIRERGKLKWAMLKISMKMKRVMKKKVMRFGPTFEERMKRKIKDVLTLQVHTMHRPSTALTQ